MLFPSRCHGAIGAKLFSSDQKRVILFPENDRVKNHLPVHISRMCVRIYIFCFKKTRTQIKTFSLANLFVRIYVFPTPCFSTKKRAVRVVFLSVNFIYKIQLNL